MVRGLLGLFEQALLIHRGVYDRHADVLLQLPAVDRDTVQVFGGIELPPHLSIHAKVLNGYKQPARGARVVATVHGAKETEEALGTRFSIGASLSAKIFSVPVCSLNMPTTSVGMAPAFWATEAE